MRTPNCGIVILAAARLVDQRHDVRRAIRIMILQPLAKQQLQLVRQAQQHVAGRGRARLARGRENGLHLMVGDRRYHRRHQHADGNALLGQLRDRAQPGVRRCGARLERAFDLVA